MVEFRAEARHSAMALRVVNGSAAALAGLAIAAAGAQQVAAQPAPETAQTGINQTTPQPSEVSPSQDLSGAAPRADTPPTGEATTQVYDQAFFAQYNLNTAEDMLRRLPGVTAILDAASQVGQQRGLGSGGDQILIGGRRMAAKNQIVAALRRIPARSVERVELIRGTSSGIQVLSEGLVVNIILAPGARTGAGAGAFEINYRFDDRGWDGVDGLVSYSNTVGRLSYVVAAQRDLWTPLGNTPTGGFGDYSKRLRDEVYFYPNGAVQEARPQKWSRHHRKKIFTANLTYDFDNGDQVRLNALWQPFPINEIDVTPFTRFGPTGAVTLQQTEFHERKISRNLKELGGELEKRIGPGSAHLVFIGSRNEVGTTDYRVRADPRVFTEVSRSGSSQKTAEDILRGSYSWPVFPGQDLNIGAEIARNGLEQDLEVFFDRNRDGLLEPVTIPTAHAEVDELRGEGFAIHNWRISPKLTLESSLSVEVSRITTNYPSIPVHTYAFPKPRFDLRYSVTPQDRLRFKLERTVSQLEFNNFVPLYNVVDDRIDLGNPEIAPEKTWILEAGYERRLPGDNGTVEGRVFYRAITDLIDRGPFGLSTGLPTSAPINIDKARLYGAEVKGGVRLAFVGLRNAQVNFRYLQQFSNVVDPFTGRDRKLKEPFSSEVTVGFRHDLTGLGASYGVNLQDTGGFQLLSDIRNREYYSRGMRFDAFVEKTLWANLTLRFEAYNLTHNHEFRRRILFAVSQADGRVSQSQYYEEIRDRRFAVRLRGKF